MRVPGLQALSADTPMARRLRHLIAYFAVGGCAGLTHLGIAWGLVWFAGVNMTVASLAGFVAGNPVSYFGHKFFTFSVPEPDGREYMRFVISAVIGLSLSSLLPVALVRGLNAPEFLALFITVIVIPVVNYLFMRFWVFARAIRLKAGS